MRKSVIRKDKVLKEIKIFAEANGVKRAAAMLLSVVLALGALSGCGNNGGNSGKDGGASAKGRYVEEEITLPVEAGEEIVSLSKSKNGNPVLFSCMDGVQVNRHEYVDGQWESSSLDWLEPVFGSQEVYVLDVQETGDGTQIVMGMDENQLTHIARSDDGQTGEALEIPYLAQQTEYGYPVIAGILVDGAGNYWLQDMYQQKFAVISADTLETVQELDSVLSFSSMQKLMFRNEEGGIAANTEEGVFTIYDKELAEQGTFSTYQQTTVQLCGDGENWYMISEDGITRIAEGNDIREVIMDGSMGAMGSPANTPAGAVLGAEEDFYVLYDQEKSQTSSLAHYVYDAEIAAVPEKTLRVFGLTENDTVHEAITGFQTAHPDVKVEFQTSGKAAGDISTDDIRTLNTELLSGNGADILLLDGLPVDAYVEKGILADMTELADELMSQEDYLEDILKNTAQKDGKIYGLPVKFAVPILYGNEEVKEALKSFDSLKAYLEEQPDASVFGLADSSYIRDFLFQIYQDEILEENGKIDQEKLAELLEIEGKIAVNARSEIFENDVQAEQSEGSERTPFSNFGSGGIINHPEGVSTNTINNVGGMMVPYAVMRQMELTADSVNEMYLPIGTAGINQNSRQKELAEEFVKYLFSEEVQSAQLDDGFPVLASALDKQKDEADSGYAQLFSGMSSWNFEGEEEIVIETGYPSVEEVESLIKMCKSLTKPAEQDRVIWNIYQEAADQYLEGSVDAETAAGNVAQKVDMYLAE